ncbi:MAG: hypothetical protein JKY42_05455 [Flavobacteriales bacterium]|nr:hypothetical protein [Flavobacteriales bacterium]
MSYTLYIANYCPSCTRVKEFISAHEIDCEVINLDESEVETPMPIMIFPALIQGDKLLAYGCDIKPYFKRVLELT